MPEYLRALVVILVLAGVVFAFAKKPATAVALSEPNFINRRNTWLLITLAGFLSQNYWVFVAILVVIVYRAAQKDSNRVALFFFIVLALPQIKVEIPGFAGIRYLIDIDYVRIITLILLLPLCLAARKEAVKNKAPSFTADKILFLYILLNLILQAQYDSTTGLIRSTINWTIGVIIPYYAISRSVKSVKDFQDIFMSFAIAGMLAAAVAIVEFARKWLLYASAGDALGVAFNPGYLARSDYLRAMATSGQPIVLGCVMVVAIGFYTALHKAVPDKKIYWLGFALLVGGLLAPLSKGPWLGAAAFGLVMLFTGENAAKLSIKLVLVGIIASVVLASTDVGQKVISFLPFIGTVDAENLTYRQRLFDSAYQIILNNPLFGSSDYLLYMEDMRQGQGIIDLVNTYIIVALNTGLVGLLLYSFFFLFIGFGIFVQLKRSQTNAEIHLFGRVLFGSSIAFLLMIVSVSPIYHIPLFLWSLAALGLAFKEVKVRIS